MPSIRPPMSACIAGLVASALGGVAMASPMQFTTFNSATSSLSSWGGNPSTSFVTSTVPTTWTGGSYEFMGALSQSGTGIGRRFAAQVGTNDQVTLWYNSPSTVQFTVRFTFDLTFNSTSGAVLFTGDSESMAGSWTVTPQGGSAAPLAVGNVFANGRYSFVWDFVRPAGNEAINSLFFALGTPSAVPGGAGLAALAFGAAGLRRRRRA